MKEVMSMDNEKKCNKYEALFIFSDDEAFNNHVKDCPDCQKEHEKYLKVSKLIKEVAPVYLERMKEKKNNNLKKLACCFIAFIGLTSFSCFKMYDNYVAEMNADFDSCVSAIGLPVDEYGFLEL